jgi:pimeloyl-ACP methyl ester carboxylesterase
LVFAGTPVFAQQAKKQEERLLNVEGYQLFLKIERGTDPNLPTLLLEAGGGADSSHWGGFPAQLAMETGATVIAYDRAGFGRSPLPDRPYNIEQEVTAIHAALVALDLDSRVLLIGHSFGGFLIQIYTSLWPGTVQGLLFLDPNTPAVMHAGGSEIFKPITNPETPKQRSLARVDAAGRAPHIDAYRAQLPLDIPLIVLSAETPPFSTPRQQELFRLAHQLLAASVTDGQRVVLPHTTHMFPMQQGQLIVPYVKQLLAKGRK